jgi:hypothetical protein
MRTPLATLSLVLLATLAAAGEEQRIQIELKDVAFAIDLPAKSTQDSVLYTANGNNISFMVYPRSDPAWETIRTPELALENVPNFPLQAGERIVAKQMVKVKRKDGAWIVKRDLKTSGASPRDDPKANTSWHISRYVYIGNRIIIMQGCWFKNGDIDQDYRTFDLITDTIRIR